MSDVRFDADRCRNIMVDIRYVLWVTDVYAGATHLVQEMTLTERDPDNLSRIGSPLVKTGIGRGYEQDEGELREEFRRRSLEKLQEAPPPDGRRQLSLRRPQLRNRSP